MMPYMYFNLFGREIKRARPDFANRSALRIQGSVPIAKALGLYRERRESVECAMRVSVEVRCGAATMNDAGRGGSIRLSMIHRASMELQPLVCFVEIGEKGARCVIGVKSGAKRPRQSTRIGSRLGDSIRDDARRRKERRQTRVFLTITAVTSRPLPGGLMCHRVTNIVGECKNACEKVLILCELGTFSSILVQGPPGWTMFV